MLSAARAGASGAAELLGSLQEHLARNLIGGRWQFPAAPYEFEIRSPVDSRVIAVVPLSSRFEVAAAVTAARAAARDAWRDPGERAIRLREFLDHLARRQVDLAVLQSAESGLSVADSSRAIKVALRQLADRLAVNRPAGPAGGVAGHILSWGLPVVEALTSVWPSLGSGQAVVIKPSLRAPLSAAYLGLLAAESGIPAGVVNVVQGTGADVGAELIRRQDLAGLHVRAGERTTAAARRARTGVPLHTVSAGGNVCVVGRHPLDVDRLAAHVTAMVRMNSAGGVFGLPLLAVHPDAAARVLPAVLDGLTGLQAAPLPSDSVRGRCLAGMRTVTEAGATVLLGGPQLPDDVEHRMGWRVPPTVLALGTSDSAAAAAWKRTVPLGPVLGVLTVVRPSEISDAVAAGRCGEGFAWAWGWEMDAAA